MTRTERSTFPKAIIKDRSESKTGLDKSLRKGGAGTHNWGSIVDEQELEAAALADEALEFGEEETSSSLSDESQEKKANSARSPISPTAEELAHAKQFRKNVFKGEVDLAAIARTSSAVANSPPKSNVTPHVESV